MKPMKTIAAGSPAVVSLSLVDAAGQPVLPTALRWRLLDEGETVLQTWIAQALPDQAQDFIEITVAGAFNLLTPPQTKGARSVELEITHAGGVHVVAEFYLLRAGSVLVVGESSHLTYAQALMHASSHPAGALSGWERFDDREQREAALVQAFEAIKRMPLVIVLERGSPAANDIAQAHRPAGGYQKIEYWLNALDAEEYAALVPLPQRTALQRAQLLEASELLEADPVTIARRNGLMSLTVGESSQFFGQAKPLESPLLSLQAQRLLAPWMRVRTRIGRG